MSWEIGNANFVEKIVRVEIVLVMAEAEHTVAEEI